MRLFFLIYLFQLPLLLFGQEEHYQSLELKIKNGLPAAQIGSGFQSSRGFIWFSTTDAGFVRYDGTNIKTYNHEKAGLPSNYITLLLEAPDSMIWIKNELSGEQKFQISIFNPITEKITPFKEFFKDKLAFALEDIIHIAQNFDGRIFIYTIKGNIYAYDGHAIKAIGKLPNTILENAALKNYYYIGNAMLCITSRLSNQDVKIIYAKLRGEIIKEQILPNTSHLFPVGLFKAKNSSYHSVFVHTGLPTTDEIALLKLDFEEEPRIIDRQKMTRCSNYMSNGKVIFKHNESYTAAYDTEMKLFYQIDHDKDCLLEFVDRQDGFWVSKGLGNLRRLQYNKRLFQKYELPGEALRERQGRGITEDLNNNILVARFGFLLYFLEKDKKIQVRKELRHGTGLFLDRKRAEIWLGYSDGVVKMNAHNIDEQVIYPRTNKKGYAIVIWQPFVDKTGKVWVGAGNGLYFINKQDTVLDNFEQYNQYEPLLKGRSVFAFHENEMGIWLATSNGVFLLDPEKGLINHFHEGGKGQNHLAHNIIAHIYEDKNGWFWLASKGGGLIHWNPKTGEQEQFTTENSLFNNLLYAVYEDDYGQLWLPSNYGIMRFDKKTKEAIVYLKEHGLPDLEFNTVSHYKATDGRLFFGGVKGTVAFHPRDFVAPKTNSAIRITGFRKQNYEDEVYFDDYSKIVSSKKITFSPTDKFVELSFALLDFFDIENHRYAYKIVGYDKNWQDLKDPIIKINSLPYGNYTLHVRAQAPGKAWQELAFPIEIEVLKPFYQQWWFIILALGSLIIGIFAAVRWRFLALKKRKAELEHIVQERTAEIAQQAEELKNLDKVKSRFFANISHELRTPLTLILGPISSLQAKPFGSLDERAVRKSLDMVTRNGKNLLVLIEEVLELSKLEADKIEIHEKATVFKPFLQRIYSSFDSLAELNEIKYHLDYNLPKELPLLIDRQKIEKIINNLLSNAFKFTAPGNEIILKVTEREGNIRFTLKDSGMGIDKADLPYVFDRFYQSKSPELVAQGGTGIGLALCKEFVELMDGRIWVTSEYGKGSQFFVEIPKKIAPITVPEAYQEILQNTSTKEKMPENWLGSQKGKTLLLVEDNRDMQDFIYSLLSPNYKILTANNGIEGLELLKTDGKEIDLIISDAMMPLMDGFSMLEQIKADELWRSLPVIMLTARAAEEDKLQALTIGVDDYLIKPFSTEELQVRIKNLLENYENRKLWKQDLLVAATNIHLQQKMNEPQQLEELQETLEEAEEEEDSISQQDLFWMKEVEKEIKATLTDEGFDIQLLAQKMLLSKRQFERKIKKITGLSPAKLVTEIRMQTARNYLEKGTYQSITEVSLAVGMQTPGYFSKQYFKRFGKKVGDYFK